MTKNNNKILSIPFIEIDQQALIHNFHRVKALCPSSKILSVIKGNAYGHGLVRIAKLLEPYTDGFGVARVKELEWLRQSNIKQPVLLMGGFHSQEELFETASLSGDTMVHNHRQIDALEGSRLPHSIRIWLKINTTFNRLGFTPEETSNIYKRLKNCSTVKEIILTTHFSDADNVKKPKTTEQIALFNQVTQGLNGCRSLANSAAVLSYPNAHADWVRPGIMLYGCSPIAGSLGKDHQLTPVMTFGSKLIAAYQIKKGETVGYASTWRAPENMPVGIAAVGYADGYPFHIKPETPVLVNGKHCQIIGRVAMDLLTIDLRYYPTAEIGDSVTLWGKELPPEIIAESAGTIPYEVLCGITPRVTAVTR